MVAFSTAAIAGGALVLGAAGSLWGALSGQTAARKAAHRQEIAAQKGVNAIQSQFDPSLQGINDWRSQLGGLYGQDMQLGQDANARLRQTILGGDMSGLQMDPGYAFRLQQGNAGIQRAATAAGSFGGTGNLQDFAGYNQGLASQEYGNAINRLYGLSGIGQQATSNFANQNQSLLGSELNLRGNYGVNIANAYNQKASGVNNYNLMGTDAMRQGMGGVSRGLNDFATNMTFADAYKNYNPNNNFMQFGGNPSGAPPGGDYPNMQLQRNFAGQGY